MIEIGIEIGDTHFRVSYSAWLNCNEEKDAMEMVEQFYAQMLGWA